MNTAAVTAFARYIESELGIIYAEFNLFQLNSRLEDACQQLGVPTIEELWIKLQSGLPRDHKQLLLDIATNNETSFFRDAPVFDLVAARVLNEGTRAAGTLNVWCAACSYGQEPLSLAMLARERSAADARPVRILATDVSERVLARAARGLYSSLEINRGLAPRLREKYFRAVPPDRYQAREDVLGLIEYRARNLLAEFDHGRRFELILCRNVMIYQSLERKKKIVARLHDALVPGGHLVLGAGEGLIGLSEAFEAINVGGAIIYRRR